MTGAIKSVVQYLHALSTHPALDGETVRKQAEALETEASALTAARSEIQAAHDRFDEVGQEKTRHMSLAGRVVMLANDEGRRCGPRAARIEHPPHGHIELTAAEAQSGYNRVRWAEGLIRQLPEDHEGRNSWLLNYGRKAPDAPDALPVPCWPSAPKPRINTPGKPIQIAPGFLVIHTIDGWVVHGPDGALPLRDTGRAHRMLRDLIGELTK